MSILFIPFIFFLLFQLWRQIMRKRCNIPWRDPFSGGGWCHPAAVLFLISQEEVEEEERLLPFFPLRPHLHFEVLVVVVVVFWLFLPRVGGGGVRRCIITPFTSFYFSQIRRQHVHINRRPSKSRREKKTPMTSRSESLGVSLGWGGWRDSRHPLIVTGSSVASSFPFHLLFSKDIRDLRDECQVDSFPLSLGDPRTFPRRKKNTWPITATAADV